MQLSDDIKEFLEQGGRCLIVEDGKPKFVISTFGDYLRLAHISSPEAASETVHPGFASQINRDIEALLKETNAEEESAAPSLRERPPKHVFYADEPS